MPKKRKKKSKKMDKKVLVGIAAGAIILLVILILFSKGGFDLGNKYITEARFEYLNYVVVDEALIKKNCPAVNVGRCDTFGGEIGANCFNREIDLFFKIEGMSYKDITCTAVSGTRKLGDFNLEKKDSSLYLPIRVDIRKYNKVDICCKTPENPNEICLEPIGINAVC